MTLANFSSEAGERGNNSVAASVVGSPLPEFESIISEGIEEEPKPEEIKQEIQ